jgi:hypothetical protein
MRTDTKFGFGANRTHINPLSSPCSISFTSLQSHHTNPKEGANNRSKYSLHLNHNSQAHHHKMFITNAALPRIYTCYALTYRLFPMFFIPPLRHRTPLTRGLTRRYPDLSCTSLLGDEWKDIAGGKKLGNVGEPWAWAIRCVGRLRLRAKLGSLHFSKSPASTAT